MVCFRADLFEILVLPHPWRPWRHDGDVSVTPGEDICGLIPVIVVQTMSPARAALNAIVLGLFDVPAVMRLAGPTVVVVVVFVAVAAIVVAIVVIFLADVE